MTEYVKYAMLGLLGLLGLFLVLGMFFGAVRGFKKAGIRLATVVVALTLALLLTPLFSGMIKNVQVGDMGTVGEITADKVFMGEMGQDIRKEVPGIEDFVLNFAIAVVNFVMFIALYFVFKFISWIVYFILTKVFLKNQTKKERKLNPMHKHRLLGCLVGIVTGFVFFAFLMIPLNGMIQGFDEVATYGKSAQFAGVAAVEDGNLDDEKFTLGDVVGKDGLNDQIQSSIYGRVTRYTGMQQLGKFGVRYLSRVDKNFNLADDMVSGGKIGMDALAIVSAAKENKELGNPSNWGESEYNFVINMTKRVFELGIIQSGFEFVTGDDDKKGVVDVMENRGTFDGKLENVSEDEDFKKDSYRSVKSYTRWQNICDDIVGVLEIAKVLFVADANGNKLAVAFKDVFANIGHPEDLKANVKILLGEGEKEGMLGSKANNYQGAKRLTDKFFGLHFVQTLFTGGDLSSIYCAPIANKISTEEKPVEKGVLKIEATTEDWASVSEDATRLIVNIVESLELIADIAHGEGDNTQERLANAFNRDGAICKPDENGKADGIVGVLNTLTNSKAIGVPFRTIIKHFIDDAGLGAHSDDEEELDGASKAMNNAMNNALETIKSELSTNMIEEPDHTKHLKPIDWYSLLCVLRDASNFAVSGMNDSTSLQRLLETASESELVAGIVTDFVTSLVDSSTNGQVVITGLESDEDKVAFMGAIAGSAGTLVDLLNGGEDADLKYENPDDLLIILGGGEENSVETLVKLAKIPGLNITVDIETEAMDEAIDNLVAGDESVKEEDKEKTAEMIKKLFTTK